MSSSGARSVIVVVRTTSMAYAVVSAHQKASAVVGTRPIRVADCDVLGDDIVAAQYDSPAFPCGWTSYFEVGE